MWDVVRNFVHPYKAGSFFLATSAEHAVTEFVVNLLHIFHAFVLPVDENLKWYLDKNMSCGTCHFQKNKVEDEKPTSTFFNCSEAKWASLEVFPHPDMNFMISLNWKFAFRYKYRKIWFKFQIGVGLWVRWIDWIMKLFQISCELDLTSDLSPQR